MLPYLLLFDIDGTLISSGGAGNRALNRACEEILNMPEACTAVRLDGMTDRAIVRQILKSASGHSDVTHLIDAILERYLSYLPDEVKASERYEVLPGIEKIMSHLANDDHFFLALATGNLKRGAQIKLERASLYAHFQCGGFGCDSEVRSQLVAVAIQRAEEILGERLPSENIFVIGDTQHDIAAGQALNVKTVAVSTGSYSNSSLANYKPDYLFNDLSDIEKFLNIFS